MLLKQWIKFVQWAVLRGPMKLSWDIEVAFCSFLILSHSSFNEVHSLGVFLLNGKKNLHGKRSTNQENPPLALHSEEHTHDRLRAKVPCYLCYWVFSGVYSEIRYFWRITDVLNLRKTMRLDRWPSLNSGGEKLQERILGFHCSEETPWPRQFL